MAGNTAVEVDAAIDRAPVGPLTVLVLLLSFVVITFDGYNMICLSFIAAPLAKDLAIPVARFGPLFSAAVFGVLGGGLIIGPASDRLGRKAILIASVALFGLFSLLPVVGLTYNQLLICRLVTGVGLGGAIPAAAALTAEYSPRRLRSLFSGLMFGGVAVGGVVGGFLASRLVPHYGWQAVFWIGGSGPVVLVPLLALLMPESIIFLAAFGRKPAYIARILSRIDRNRVYTADERFVCGEPRTAKGSIPDLFHDGRAAGTLLIWSISFCVLFAYGLLVSWLPTVMAQAGMPLPLGILGPVALNLGGLFGTVALGLIARKLGLATPICGGLMLTAVGLLITGNVIANGGPVLLVIAGTGFFLQGALNMTNALMAGFYPTSIRSTGVGWALGAGRVGGIIGPSIGGLLLAPKPGTPSLFTICALVAVIGAMAAASVGLRYRRGAAAPSAV